MQVTNDPTSANQAAASTTKTSSSGTDALANKEVFLQMLVAQIKNQDPLNPTDGAQFMTQLAQFSSLEQLIGIRQDLETATTAASTTGTTDSTANSASNTTTDAAVITGAATSLTNKVANTNPI